MKKEHRTRLIERRAQDWRDGPESYIEYVQQGDRRIQYRPRRDWLLTLLVLAFGFTLAMICFSEGVRRGTTIGIEACRAGDSVLVDPAVGGES